MLRKRHALLALILLLSSFGHATQLINNGDFENGKTSWASGIPPNSQATVEVGPQGCKIGQCLKIVLNGGENANANQFLGSLNPGATLYMTVDANAAADASLLIGVYDRNWRAANCSEIGMFLRPQIIKGEGKWRKFTYQVQIPFTDDCGAIDSNHNWYAYLYAVIPNAQNTPVYFDDATLTEKPFLKNGQFKGLKDWTFTHDPAKSPTLEYLPAGCLHESCYQIRLNDAERASVNQPIGKLLPNARYRLSVWAKATAGSNLLIGLSDRDWQDSTCTTKGKFLNSGPKSGSGAWKEYAYDANIPDKDDCGNSVAQHNWFAYVYAVTPADNAIDFDDASLSEVPKVKNGGFETDFAYWNKEFASNAQATIKIETADCIGTKCLSIQPNAAPNPFVQQQLGVLKPETDYSLEAKVKSSTPSTAQVTLFDNDWRNATCSRVGKRFSSKLLTQGTGWQPLSQVVSVPAQDDCGPIDSTHNWFAALYALKPNDANSPVIFDEVSLNQVIGTPTPTPTPSPALCGNQPCLSANDTGMYGSTPWLRTGQSPSGDFYTRTNGMTTVIRTSIGAESARIRYDEVRAEIDEGLKANPQKRIILEVYFWNNLDEQNSKTNPDEIPYYQNKINTILDRMNKPDDSSTAQPDGKIDKLYAITLGEENWIKYVNGSVNPVMARYLNELYKGTKNQDKYRNLQIYQWYDYRLGANNPFPEKYAGIYPGADGWIVEELRLNKKTCGANCPFGDDPYRRILQKFLITGKPVITELWAATTRPDQYGVPPFSKLNPTVQEYEEQMFSHIKRQFDTNQEFNLPTTFYYFACSPAETDAACHPGNGKNQTARFTTTSSWFPHPPANPLYGLEIQRAMDAQVRKHILTAQSRTAGFSGFDSQQKWDSPAISLPCTQDAPEYVDDFEKNNLVDTTSGEGDGTGGSGFRNLVWEPGKLSVRTFNSQPIDARITYHFKCPVSVDNARATATFTVNTNGLFKLDVSRNNRDWWTAASSNSGTLSVDLDGTAGGNDVYLRVTMTSPDNNPDHLPLTLTQLEIGPKSAGRQPGTPNGGSGEQGSNPTAQETGATTEPSVNPTPTLQDATQVIPGGQTNKGIEENQNSELEISPDASDEERNAVSDYNNALNWAELVISLMGEGAETQTLSASKDALQQGDYAKSTELSSQVEGKTRERIASNIGLPLLVLFIFIVALYLLLRIVDWLGKNEGPKQPNSL